MDNRENTRITIKRILTTNIYNKDVLKVIDVKVLSKCCFEKEQTVGKTFHILVALALKVLICKVFFPRGRAWPNLKPEFPD